MRDIPLLLFAKAPIPGQVKTRLQSHCSPQQSASIAKILLEECLIRATENWPGRVVLSARTDPRDSVLKALAQKYQVNLVEQSQGDLGNKMHSAFEQHGYPAAILGCDAPHIKPRDLKLAYDELAMGNNVLGPSLDGGYYIIGLSESQPELFDDMPWGSEHILQKTIAAANAQGMILQHLGTLNDVDHWQDLLEVAEQLASVRRYLSAERLI